MRINPGAGVNPQSRRASSVPRFHRTASAVTAVDYVQHFAPARGLIKSGQCIGGLYKKAEGLLEAVFFWFLYRQVATQPMISVKEKNKPMPPATRKPFCTLSLSVT